jgi:DNA-binding transcriptional LysR family regulator
LDLAIVALSSDEPALSKHLIMRDEIVLVTSPNHRLSQLPTVSIKDVREEVLIAESGKSSLREEVAQAFRSAGAEFDPAVTNVTLEGIKRMVTEGVGIGFVPSVCIHEEERRRELAVIRVEGISRQRELRLVHRKNESLSPAAHAFLKVSLQCAREWAKSMRDNTASPHASTNATRRSSEAVLRRSYC